MEWFLGFLIFTLYFMCLFTVCSITFRRGYTFLGIMGIFLPILWVIGAFLPAKPGSQEDIMNRTGANQNMRNMTA